MNLEQVEAELKMQAQTLGELNMELSKVTASIITVPIAKRTNQPGNNDPAEQNSQKSTIPQYIEKNNRPREQRQNDHSPKTYPSRRKKTIPRNQCISTNIEDGLSGTAETAPILKAINLR